MIRTDDNPQNESSTRVHCIRPNCDGSVPLSNDLLQAICSGNSVQYPCPQCNSASLVLEGDQGRFLLTRRTRGGGFSRTYHAVRLQNNGQIEEDNGQVKRYFVKQFYPSPDNQQVIESHPERISILQGARQRFCREGEFLEQLNCPHIPRFIDFFSLTPRFLNGQTQSVEPNLYIVQEYVGDRNLEDERSSRRQFSELEIAQILKDILEALICIQNCGSEQDNNQVIARLHRDINPNNIVLNQHQNGCTYYLVDLGTVGELIAVETRNETRFIPRTFSYVAPERLFDESITPTSDIWSLALTCAVLLTRQEPPEPPQVSRSANVEQVNAELRWRSQWERLQSSLKEASPVLFPILNKMLAFKVSERYQSLQEALRVVEDVCKQEGQLPSNGGASFREGLDMSNPNGSSSRSPSRSQKFLAWTLVSLSLCLLIFIGYPRFSLENYLSNISSFGEENLTLIQSESSEIPPDLVNKQDGIQAFQKGQYSEAIKSFVEARRERPRDPDTLIFLNNSKIRLNQPIFLWLERLLGNHPYRIAVVLPLKSHGDQRIIDLSLTVLRGVAQIQDEVNNGGGINGKSLEILIVDEPPNEAQKVAKALSARSDIVTVIGPLESSSTEASFAEYVNGGLPFITPTATTENFTELCKEARTNSRGYCFRTVPGNKDITFIIADFLKKSTVAEYDKPVSVAILHTGGNPYSESIKEQFCDELDNKSCSNLPRSSLAAEYDFNQIPLNDKDKPEEEVVLTVLEQMKTAGAETLLLFPSSRSEDIDKAIAIAKYNQEKDFGFLIVGGDTLYDPNLLSEAGEELQGVVFASPWHRLSNPNTEFRERSDELWNKARTSWETAMAADATSAVVQALKEKRDSNRDAIQKALAKPGFSIPSSEAATGEVKFKTDDGTRIQNTTRLVTVVRSECSNPPYSFTLYNPGLPITEDPECND